MRLRDRRTGRRERGGKRVLFVQRAAGSLILPGTNAFTGGTTMGGGTLNLVGSLAGAVTARRRDGAGRPQ